ncbi:hypothetical protein ERJ75_001804900 [Trypanosoma vivax]|nr:hypothetical protein ERJ75_001804900 [Trypanosoma vivax]
MLRVRVRLACSPFAVQSAGWSFVSCEYVLDRRLTSRRERQASAWSAPGHVGPPVAQGRLLDARRCDDGMCAPAYASSSARGDGERGGVPPCIPASVRAPFRACNLLRDRDRQVGQSVASACRQSFIACPDRSQDTVVSIPCGALRDSSACATFPVFAGHGTGLASVTLHSRRSSSRRGSVRALLGAASAADEVIVPLAVWQPESGGLHVRSSRSAHRDGADWGSARERLSSVRGTSNTGSSLQRCERRTTLAAGRLATNMRQFTRGRRVGDALAPGR